MYAYMLYICLYIACMHTLMQTHLHMQRKYLRGSILPPVWEFEVPEESFHGAVSHTPVLWVGQIMWN